MIVLLKRANKISADLKTLTINETTNDDAKEQGL